jgi:dihydroorotate dehydrogenase electron transfer subunit
VNARETHLHQVEATIISNQRFFADSVHPNKRITGTRLMWMDCPEIAAEARPGQFVMVRCGDLTLPRPFSLHQVRQDSIALLYSVFAEGQGTTWLGERRADDKLAVLGPLGNGFTVDDSARRLLVVAGGIGVAPLHFLAQQAVDAGKKVTLMLGAQTGSLLYPRHLLPRVDILTATDDGSAGYHGPVTALVKEHSRYADQVFACGPLAMYRDMAPKPEEFGLEAKPVHVSLEAVMACGHGACYGCTIKTTRGLKQVCKEGPVFALDEVLWEEMRP